MIICIYRKKLQKLQTKTGKEWEAKISTDFLLKIHFKFLKVFLTSSANYYTKLSLIKKVRISISIVTRE
jgi:hypothetical protein